MTDNVYAPPTDERAGPSLLAVLFSFDGRIRRRMFVAAELGWVGTALVAQLAFDLAGGGVDDELWMLPLLFVYLWSNLALHVKRLHDIGWPATYLAGIFVPGLGPLAYFLVGALARGTVGPNRFGPDPRDPTADQGAFDDEWDPAVEDELEDG